MIKNYFITAIRNLMREKSSAFLNIAGLTLGIACSLILFLLVKHQATFDRDHTKRDRIYRVVSQSEGNHGKRYSPGIPPVLPDAFRNDFPEAEEVVFTSYRSETMITIPQEHGEPKKYYEESGIVFTEPNFFKIFDRLILFGDAAKALDEPSEAIISKRWALKYFGKEDARNEILKFDTLEYKVTAVMEDYPSNTDFPFDLMLSFITVKQGVEAEGWGSVWSDEHCYFLLREGEDINKLTSRLSAFLEKYRGKDDAKRSAYLFQPLSEIHFDDRFNTYSYNTTSKGMLIALGVIGLILILTACINFINLATAEAIKRSKEVGIRKSLGSTRAQLVRQFLGETTLITVLSTLSALAVVQLALTLLNPFLELSLGLNFSSDISLWIYVVGVTVTVSLLAGLYPAFVVSGFNPVMALKNLINNKNSSGYNMRRALVVTQFVISQFFIIGTIVVIHQMNYFQTKDLGFNKEAIINLPIPVTEVPTKENGVSKMRTLRDEVLKIPGVKNASLSNKPPSSSSISHTNFTIEGNDQDFTAQVKQIDSNYINLFGLDLLYGSNVGDGDTATGFIVNEKLAKSVGFENSRDILGKEMKLWGRSKPIVGVVKDFHTVSLREPIEATVMLNAIWGYETLSVDLDYSRVKEITAAIKPKWEATYPEHIYDYQFLDQQIAEFYESEKRMSVMLGIFSGIAIFIGCLGLFGLATFMVNQKTKEVGVRKVLGASVESIVMLFSREYFKLIVIGFFVAAPLSWYVMNKFLEEFTYKIEIGPTVFLIGFGVTLLMAIVTVGYKSVKSAIANPVNSLRSE
jgi:putative ABC transport system permease protein